MSNEFAVKPTLDAGFPSFPTEWTCPITGLVVPKDPQANIEYRANILAQAENDFEMQQALYTACSQSLLYFVNVFGFTLRVFETEDGEVRPSQDVHLPYVTWPIQDKHLLALEQAIETGKSLLTDKSRDMGATWDHIIFYVHRFLFRSDESHLVLSRKEATVDILDGLPKNYPYGPLADPGTLFGKIDYALNRLPKWMLPKMSRKKLHLVNLDNKSRIDGESANATAGSSDRRKSIFMDEMAKMDEAESIKRSTRAVTATRFPCSTPNGAGTAFSLWRLSGQIPVFIMPWWEHPEKGQDRYVAEDELNRFKIRSPWYDHECEECTPKEIAIEVDMDHIGSGNTVFDGTTLAQHKQCFAAPARHTRHLTFKRGVPESDISTIVGKKQLEYVAVTPRGKWRIWCNLINGRPDQSKTYTFGIDISKGQGASNSVISVICDQTKLKVAEFADAQIKPFELAKTACAAAVWFGGMKHAFIIWENNGDPGLGFGDQLMSTYKYPSVYFDRAKGTVSQKVGKRYGWRSDQDKKAVVMTALERAYTHGGFFNPSEEALDEALMYIRYDGGGIGPSALLNESHSARATHGDRVIADMLCVWGSKDRGAMGKQAVHTGTEYSIGGRIKRYKALKKQNSRSKSFDFRRQAS
jgi:hypothetical protein